MRVLKPGFFSNEDLADLAFEDRLLFAGLWGLADREGRLLDRPRRIKAEVFPYDDLNVDGMLAHLHDKGFIIRYAVDGVSCIQITTFLLHQSPHWKEEPSLLPECPGYFPPRRRQPSANDDPTLNQDSGEHEPHEHEQVTGTGTDPETSTDPGTVPRKALVERFALNGDSGGPTEAYLPDFESFFAEYPKQLGKAPACGAYRVALKRGIRSDELLSAVRNYRQHVEDEQVDDKFVPDAKRWLSEDLWRDYRAGVPRLTRRSSGNARASPVDGVRAAYAVMKSKQEEKPR